MSKIVRVAATSMATLEASAPPFNQRTPNPDDNLRLGLSILEAAGAQRADLACLPEGFMLAGIPTARLRSLAEPLSGPGVRAVADCAGRHGMYVVAGFYVLEQGAVSNVAALFDRSGKLVCTYSKIHPTEYEIDDGVRSGSEVRVFDADFGRVGFAICFDFNWPDLWRQLKEERVDLVCWISAYEGGFPLQAYAWQHQFPIVTSVWSYHAKIIERTGRVAAATSRWGRIATLDLNLAQAALPYRLPRASAAADARALRRPDTDRDLHGGASVHARESRPTTKRGRHRFGVRSDGLPRLHRSQCAEASGCAVGAAVGATRAGIGGWIAAGSRQKSARSRAASGTARDYEGVSRRAGARRRQV